MTTTRSPAVRQDAQAVAQRQLALVRLRRAINTAQREGLDVDDIAQRLGESVKRVQKQISVIKKLP